MLYAIVTFSNLGVFQAVLGQMAPVLEVITQEPFVEVYEFTRSVFLSLCMFMCVYLLNETCKIR